VARMYDPSKPAQDATGSIAKHPNAHAARARRFSPVEGGRRGTYFFRRRADHGWVCGWFRRRVSQRELPRCSTKIIETRATFTDPQ
jgi:hypothetical protein